MEEYPAAPARIGEATTPHGKIAVAMAEHLQNQNVNDGMVALAHLLAASIKSAATNFENRHLTPEEILECVNQWDEITKAAHRYFAS